MSAVENTSVPFWPEQDIRPYGSEIPLLFKMEKEFIDKDWPSNGPSKHEVLRQLAEMKKCWVSSYKPQDRVFVTFLLGKYKVTSSVGQSEGKSRLWLSRISFANNQDRARMLENGALISFDGIQLVTGREFGNGLERSSVRFGSGRYVDELLEIIKSPWRADGEEIAPEAEDDDLLNYEEREMVDVLRSFIDSEYALEQIAAQQCPPFSASSITARSQKTTYRLHYEIELQADDYARVLEMQPNLLVLLSETLEPTDVLLEVAELSPVENEPIIYVSIEKQMADMNIPENGMLGIAALPTLKKVRNAVVDNLEDSSSKNPWLLSLAAGCYEHNVLSPVEVPLPESKFPPTKSQVKAINSGAGSYDYTLVLGPPGTGKTTVILQWVKYFAAQGKRVLVTSQNNKAVDNVLERLAEEDDFECLRIGNENKISSSLEAITLDNKAAELQSKMFAQGEDALESLQRQHDELKKIVSERDDLITLVSEKEKLMSGKSDITTALYQLQGKVRILSQSQLELDEEISLIQKSLSNVHMKKWPIFNFIRQALNSLQRKKLEAELTLKTNKQGKLHSDMQTCNAEIKSSEANLVSLEPQIHANQNKIEEYFRPFRSLVSEIPMPQASTITSSELNQLDNKLAQISAIVDNLADWFEKLRNERQQALYKLLIENVNVVGATCIGINTKALFRELDFDVVIVDESGQIQLHNLIVPLSRADKAILVGDHKQLPPVVSDEVLEEIESQGFENYKDLYRLSWFEHLWNAAPEDRKIMLDTQFRCPSIISDFVSEAFYEGKYYAGVGMDKKKSILSFCPQPMVWVDTDKMRNKEEQATNQEGRAVVQDNRCETSLVISILKKAIAEKPKLAEDREIGIIVPYANHVKAIQKAIRKEQSKGQLTELKMPLNELVASVDSFQGQERDLIIFTFTRSNSRGKVGFLSDWRRLNVAQTRAKKQLIMIGDSRTLTKGAQREGAHDQEFKQAMCLLKKQSLENGALLDGNLFFGEKRKKKPSSNSNTTKKASIPNKSVKLVEVTS